jgi:hypothetical protein
MGRIASGRSVGSSPRVRAVIGIALALTMVVTAVASAGDILYKAKLDGDVVGARGQFHAEVFTNSKDVPVRMSFIEFDHPDLDCTNPGYEPFTADFFDVTFAGGNLTTQGRSYLFSTEQDSGSLSTRITHNHKKLFGTADLLQEPEDYPNYTCRKHLTFTAKRIFESSSKRSP